MARNARKVAAAHAAASKHRKNASNQIKRSNASSKMDIGRPKHGSGQQQGGRRSAETVARLKMYSNGAAIRNKKGRIVAGQFMMSDRAGDRAITGQTGRIAPDRRWFGNTRTVDPKQLDEFRREMSERTADPYSVVLKRKKVPMGLLQDAAEYSASKAGKAALLEQEPFDRAFGGKSNRKRVKLDQLMISRSANLKEQNKNKKKDRVEPQPEGQAESVPGPKGCDGDGDGDAGCYEALLSAARESQETYREVNGREGIVPWGRDRAAAVDTAAAPAASAAADVGDREGSDWRRERRDDLFSKGQSKRIWGEFFKVLDCSDVVLHVIDARDVPGTRCTVIDRLLSEPGNRHRHLVFVLNKIDLVPSWVAKRWMGELAADRPTVAFHASRQHAFGKGALINLLRQFAELMPDKKQISVGVVGYPNTGKSSVINTLIGRKSCKVAPVPGETKIWQYVTLFRRIALIDCPGVVVDSAGDTETDSVLKGVVRAERLQNPEDFVDAVLARVKREHVAAQYKLDRTDWTDASDALDRIASQFGRLRKGGDPDRRSAAVMVLYDYQRGRLPHYVAPPELKTTTKTITTTSLDDKEEGNDNVKNTATEAVGTDSTDSPDQKRGKSGDGKKTVTVQEQDLDRISRRRRYTDEKGSDAAVAYDSGGDEEGEATKGNTRRDRQREQQRPRENAAGGGDAPPSSSSSPPPSRDSRGEDRAEEEQVPNVHSLVGSGDWDDDE